MGTHRTRLGTRTRATLAGSGVVAAAAALLIGTGAASGLPGIPGAPSVPGVTSTVVTPEDTQGFAPDESGTAPEFTEDYADAPGASSKGALRLETADGSSKVNFFHGADGAPLSTFATRFGYSALRDGDSTGSAAQFPSLQLTIDPNGPAVAGGFTTLSFEPVYQTGANAERSDDEFHSYDGTTGVFCTTRQIPGFEANQTRCDNGGQKTLAEIVAANPDATVYGFGVNQGSGNPGIVSAVDDLVTPTATYDFEKTAPAVVPPVDTPDPTDPVDPADPADPGTEEPTDGTSGHGDQDGDQGGDHGDEQGGDQGGQGGDHGDDEGGTHGGGTWDESGHCGC